MALCKIEIVKINVAASLAFICFFSAAVLFSFGTIYYSNENTKILNYVNSTCKIGEITSKSYRCMQLYFSFACHVASWNLRHNNQTIMMEGTQRHKSKEGALRQANKYKVNKY